MGIQTLLFIIHLQFLLSTYCMLDTVLGSMMKQMNVIDMFLCHHEV